MNDGDEEHHQRCWLVRRHHQVARVKVGLKQRENRERKYMCVEYRTNKKGRKYICTENEKQKKKKK